VIATPTICRPRNRALLGGGKMSALSATEAALARSPGTIQPEFVYRRKAERARAKARAFDAVIASGQNAGPLAGVPFAVKKPVRRGRVCRPRGIEINR